MLATRMAQITLGPPTVTLAAAIPAIVVTPPLSPRFGPFEGEETPVPPSQEMPDRFAANTADITGTAPESCVREDTRGGDVDAGQQHQCCPPQSVLSGKTWRDRHDDVQALVTLFCPLADREGSSLGIGRLPYPLNEEAFADRHVKPLFDGVHASVDISTADNSWLAAKLGEYDSVAAEVLRQVDIVDREWDRVARWIDSGRRGRIFQAGEDVNKDVPEFELAEAEAPAKSPGGRRRQATGTKPSSHSAGFLRAQRVQRELEKVYGDMVGAMMVLRIKEDFCLASLGYRKALALRRAEKRVEEELAKAPVLATLPSCRL
jgi:hypothetical protein